MVQIRAQQAARSLDEVGSGPSVAGTSQKNQLPSKNARGSSAIASQLQQAIFEGLYKNGERLPAERELAQHFGASRSTVREALKRLEALHLLHRRIGSGTFVSYRPVQDGQNIAEVTSPLELIEVRLALEPKIAAMAAINATTKDLERIAQALEQLSRTGEDRESFSLADEQFHLRIVECTHNPLMIWLYQQINDVRSHAQWGRMKKAILSPQRIREYNQQHSDLYEALRSHDVESAVAAIEQHLVKARNELIGAR